MGTVLLRVIVVMVGACLCGAVAIGLQYLVQFGPSWMSREVFPGERYAAPGVALAAVALEFGIAASSFMIACHIGSQTHR